MTEGEVDRPDPGAEGQEGYTEEQPPHVPTQEPNEPRDDPASNEPARR